MTALNAVAAYLPDRHLPIEELAEVRELSASQLEVLRRFHGLSEVRRQKQDERLIDLLVAAVSALAELRGREQLVRYVIYARGVPVTTPYPVNPLHELCRLFGLDNAIAFTVTHQSCATSLLAIDIAGRLLVADGEPDALALVITGEKVFTHDDQLPQESRVFGEGAGACLVSAEGRRDRVLSYVPRQRGDLDHWLADNVDHAERFASEYCDVLAEVILAAVESAGLGLEEIGLILPHNVNVVSWKRVCARLGFPIGRVMLDNVPRVGHTFAADAFINYRTAAEKGLLAAGEPYLVAAAGFGAIFSAMVFEH